VGRWSFIGLRPRKVVRWSLGDEGDPYAIAAEEVARHRQAPFADMPPFAGGAVGYFGYDLVRTVEPLAEPNPDALGLPDMALMLSDVLVVFDHLRHEISVIANVYASEPGEVDAAYADALATIRKARDLLAGPVPRQEPAPDRDVPTFESNMPRADFEAMVARIVEYVHAGDAFQVVPSQRWSGAVDVDSFSIYRGLRHVNPSPYMYFLDFRDFQVAGASPEPLLTVSGRHASTRPIAGTRPRGGTPAEDARIAEELLADEKERAEHVMLVDLGRNDLGRVCEYGTVQVDSFMAVETYSHVMHIVSNVSGTLRPEVGAMDALRSVLPAGTLSGAPKVRAMQIIDELEPVKRGGYGGAIGYLSYTGDLDTCIHIRTVVIKDGVAHIQAGGGTVADAKPEYEYEESVAKARGVKLAIELAAGQPDWP
jgi:anthranilate synthase component I